MTTVIRVKTYKENSAVFKANQDYRAEGFGARNPYCQTTQTEEFKAYDRRVSELYLDDILAVG